MDGYKKGKRRRPHVRGHSSWARNTNNHQPLHFSPPLGPRLLSAPGWAPRSTPRSPLALPVPSKPLETPRFLPLTLLLLPWDPDHFPHLDGHLTRPLAPPLALPLPPNLCKLLAFFLSLSSLLFSFIATQTLPLGFHFAIARVSHCTKSSPWGRTRYA